MSDDIDLGDDLNDGPRLTKRTWQMIGGGVIGAAILLWLALSLVDPAPPRTITMATGTAGGAYAAAGEAIAQRLAEDGVTVRLVPTSGSLENLDALVNGRTQDATARRQRIDVAVVQGGLVPPESRPEDTSSANIDPVKLRSLGGVFLEPMLVFTRGGAQVTDLRVLAGRTVAVGPEGSGVRALIVTLFEENAIGPGAVRLDPRGGEEAADALLAGEVDAAVFVTSIDRPYLRALFLNDSVQAASLERAQAYARRYRYLSAVSLPEGVVDLAQNVPDAELALVAPAANLVVRDDTHPAIQVLLLQASSAEFRDGDILAAPGVFPSRDLISFPLSRQAERFFDRGGPSALRRYLPFWAANLVERLWVLLIPALTLLYPLVKSAPMVYRWRMRQRIIRWYRHLRHLERKGRTSPDPAVKTAVRVSLARMLAEVAEIKVPLPYTDDLYRLRTHIRLADQLVAESARAGQGLGDDAVLAQMAAEDA